MPETLTRIVTGGDTIMPWVYDVLRKRLPHVNLTQSYGLTEGGALAVVLDMDDAAGHENSVGRPQPMTEVKVVDLEGGEVQIGEVREVCVRSPGGPSASGNALRKTRRPSATDGAGQATSARLAQTESSRSLADPRT